MGGTSELENNKAVVRRHLEEIFGSGNPSVLSQTMSPEVVWHAESNPSGKVTAESLQKARMDRISAFPDCQLIIQDMIAEGDRVSVRTRVVGTHHGGWNSAGGFLRVTQPAGKRFDIQVQMIYRLRHGRVIERWVVHDWLGMLTQLGVLRPE